MVSYDINEEPCPVADDVIGQLYRSHPQGLADIIETVPSDARAALALYCFRRAHLNSIGLAIAASCDQHLFRQSGTAGADLFAKSRSPDVVAKEGFYSQRRKVTVATTSSA